MTSSTTGLSAEESTPSQLLTSDVSSSIMPSMKTTDAATTTDSITTSELITDAQTSVIHSLTNSLTDDVYCCCRCCFPSTNTCKLCEGDTLTDASKCANEKPKITKPVNRNAPKWEVPSARKGSQYPERMEFREDFIKLEELTENLASLSESQRIDLGFKSSDLIVDCLYDGKPCSIEQLVEKNSV